MSDKRPSWIDDNRTGKRLDNINWRDYPVWTFDEETIKMQPIDAELAIYTTTVIFKHNGKVVSEEKLKTQGSQIINYSIPAGYIVKGGGNPTLKKGKRNEIDVIKEFYTVTFVMTGEDDNGSPVERRITINKQSTNGQNPILDQSDIDGLRFDVPIKIGSWNKNISDEDKAKIGQPILDDMTIGIRMSKVVGWTMIDPNIATKRVTIKYYEKLADGTNVLLNTDSSQKHPINSYNYNIQDINGFTRTDLINNDKFNTSVYFTRNNYTGRIRYVTVNDDGSVRDVYATFDVTKPYESRLELGDLAEMPTGLTVGNGMFNLTVSFKEPDYTPNKVFLENFNLDIPVKLTMTMVKLEEPIVDEELIPNDYIGIGLYGYGLLTPGVVNPDARPYTFKVKSLLKDIFRRINSNANNANNDKSLKKMVVLIPFKLKTNEIIKDEPFICLDYVNKKLKSISNVKIKDIYNFTQTTKDYTQFPTIESNYPSVYNTQVRSNLNPIVSLDHSYENSNYFLKKPCKDIRYNIIAEPMYSNDKFGLNQFIYESIHENLEITNDQDNREFINRVDSNYDSVMFIHNNDRHYDTTTIVNRTNFTNVEEINIDLDITVAEYCDPKYITDDMKTYLIFSTNLWTLSGYKEDQEDLYNKDVDIYEVVNYKDLDFTVGRNYKDGVYNIVKRHYPTTLHGSIPSLYNLNSHKIEMMYPLNYNKKYFEFPFDRLLEMCVNLQHSKRIDDDFLYNYQSMTNMTNYDNLMLLKWFPKVPTTELLNFNDIGTNNNLSSIYKNNKDIDKLVKNIKYELNHPKIYGYFNNDNLSFDPYNFLQVKYSKYQNEMMHYEYESNVKLPGIYRNYSRFMFEKQVELTMNPIPKHIFSGDTIDTGLGLELELSYMGVSLFIVNLWDCINRYLLKFKRKANTDTSIDKPMLCDDDIFFKLPVHLDITIDEIKGDNYTNAMIEYVNKFKSTDETTEEVLSIKPFARYKPHNDIPRDIPVTKYELDIIKGLEIPAIKNLIKNT